MPLSKNNFHVNPIVQEEMTRLRIDAKYELSFVSFQKFQKKNYNYAIFKHSFIKITFFGPFKDQNILASHILCLNETKTKNIHTNLNIYITTLENFHIISCYDQQENMILYNKTMISSKLTTMTHFGPNSSLQHLTRTHIKQYLYLQFISHRDC